MTVCSLYFAADLQSLYITSCSDQLTTRILKSAGPSLHTLNLQTVFQGNTHPFRDSVENIDKTETALDVNQLVCI